MELNDLPSVELLVRDFHQDAVTIRDTVSWSLETHSSFLTHFKLPFKLGLYSLHYFGFIVHVED